MTTIHPSSHDRPKSCLLNSTAPFPINCTPRQIARKIAHAGDRVFGGGLFERVVHAGLHSRPAQANGRLCSVCGSLSGRSDYITVYSRGFCSSRSSRARGAWRKVPCCVGISTDRAGRAGPRWSGFAGAGSGPRAPTQSSPRRRPPAASGPSAARG